MALQRRAVELEDELKVTSFANVSLVGARVVIPDTDEESRAVSDVQDSLPELHF